MYIHAFPQNQLSAAEQIPTPVIHRLTRTWDNPSWNHPLHAHREHVEFMFLSEGRADIRVDQNIFHCVQGDMILMDKNIIHATSSVEGFPRDTWCCLLSNVEMPTYSSEHYILKCNAQEYYGYVRQVFEQILEFSRSNEVISSAICNYLIGTLLVIFQEKLRQAPVHEQVTELSFAQQVLIYINEHFTKKITLDILAKEFLTSRSRVSSEFKKEYEISPINYLIDKRLNEAIWLLLNTKNPIHQIAQSVGYDNPYHFIKLFTNRMGMSPADYRKMYI